MSSGGGGVSTTPTMNAEQRELWRRITGFVQPMVGRRAPTYGPTGPWQPGTPQQWTVPIGAGAQGAQEQYLSTLAQALRGISPAETEAQYRENILPGQQRLFQELTLPGIEEAYVGPGLSASSARQAGVAKGYQGFGEQQGQILQSMINQNQQAAYGALGQGGQLYSVNQAILDQEVQRRMQEWMRTQAIYSPYMQRAMELLGMTTQAAYGQPSSSLLASLLGAGGSIAGSLLG